MIAYFHCNKPKNLSSVFHDYSCIAEGLQSLGATCYGNMDMCQKDVQGNFLIKREEHFDRKDADWIFFHQVIYRNGVSKADETIRTITDVSNRKYKTFFIDSADGLRTPGFSKGARSCDVVLKSHYNRKYKYPSNFTPWQFGLSNRIINAVRPKLFYERDNSILVNFRAKHQLRDYVNTLIRPVIEKHYRWDDQTDSFTSDELEGNDLLYWQQTGARHYPQYYNKLSNT